MSIELKLPELGEGIDAGDVLEILVSVGDEIQRDQGIVELETEKATVSVPATQAGKITKILVEPGQTVNVGQGLVEIEPASAEAPAEKPAKKQNDAAATAEQATQRPAPAGKQGAAKHEGAERAAAEADSATQTRETAAATAEPANTAAQQPATASSATSNGSRAPVARTGGEMGNVPAGPAIRRFAREVGVDLLQVVGTGSNGRITREDVLKVVRSGTANRAPAGDRGPTAGQSGPRDNYGPVRIEKLTRIRRTIAERMHLSWTTVPRVTNFDDADITDLEEFRKQSKTDYGKQGIKLTTLPFVVKAVAVSLKSHPMINASIDMSAGQIIYKDYVHIGIAVDTERGLVVPTLRDADKLSIPQIARQLQAMAENARSGDFSIEDLRGGSFTISNLGAIGGSYSTPIVNVPETAILLIGRSRKMPVVIEDRVAIRLMMPLSISYDHRLIDGSTAARFLNDVIGYLQAPSRLLLTL